MERLPFDHYYDHFESRMRKDMLIHQDALKVLDWLADKPGAVCSPRDFAGVLSDGAQITDEFIGRAIGVAVVLSSWSTQIATPFYKVRDAAGNFHDIGLVDSDIRDGNKPYVIEETGEVIEHFPSNAYPHVRIADFEPRPAPLAVPTSAPKP